MERSTNKFEFKIAAGQDLPAIWFNLRDKEVLIYPTKLYEILWDCYRKRRISPSITAQFQIFSDDALGIYFDNSCGAYKIEYNRETFVNSAFKALKDLCGFVIECGACYYRDFTVDTAEALLLGINNLSIPQNYSQIFFDEICIEDFSFRFLEPYRCDTSYKIEIGSRSYVSNLSDWTNDFNQLRNEIESFVLSAWSEREIHLHYEDSPAILRLEAGNLFPANIVHQETVRLTIIPDEFSKYPIVFGWCRPRQVIRAIYLGLLELFTKDTDRFEDGFCCTWDEFRLRAYNQVQSCIIEDYINEKAESKQTFSYRNRIVHSVEEMLFDFKSLQTSLKQQ